MSQELSTINAIEAALVTGDLSKLSDQDRISFYNKTCESLGLNPLTKPFEYIKLNGKQTFYATRNCTDQLRSLRKVSIIKLERENIDGIYVVTAYARLGDREDSSIGAVTTQGLRGDALANAIMKAETKAKRRVTLSICGLSMLDETEVETLPKEVTADVEPKKGKPPTETPKSTALPQELGAQAQQDVSNGLKALIDRAAKGGPDAAKPRQENQELVPLKWDGQLPTCFDGLMPLGKHQGVPMTKAPIEDVKAMAKWIEDKAKKDGGVHPSLRLAYFQAQDLFENTIEPAPQEMFNPNGSARI